MGRWTSMNSTLVFTTSPADEPRKTYPEILCSHPTACNPMNPVESRNIPGITYPRSATIPLHEWVAKLLQDSICLLGSWTHEKLSYTISGQVAPWVFSMFDYLFAPPNIKWNLNTRMIRRKTIFQTAFLGFHMNFRRSWNWIPWNTNLNRVGRLFVG